MDYPEFFTEDCIGIKYRVVMINDDLVIGTLTDIYDGVAVFGGDVMSQRNGYIPREPKSIEINVNNIISVELVEQNE